jgi:hypothetical protein
MRKIGSPQRFAPMQGPRQFVQVDTSAVQKLAADLGLFRAKALPYAARSSLNTIAFDARGEWVDQMRRRLTLRNTWTERSPRVVKASGSDLGRMQSQVGSPLEYLAKQEQGFTSQAQGKYGVTIPTPFAAGQAVSARQRTRPVQRPNRLAAIHLDPTKVRSRRGGAQARRQRNAATMAIAAKTGTRHVFLDLGKRKGLFKIMGSKRLRPRLVWDLSKKTTTTAPRHMMGPALAALMPRMPGIYASAIVAELRRARILHYSRASKLGF